MFDFGCHGITRAAAALMLGTLAITGCEGTIDGLGPAGPNGALGDTGVAGANGPEGGGDDLGAPRPGSNYDEDDPGAKDRPAISTRVVRLSHAQWAHSVEDLLGLTDVEAELEGLRADPRQSGFLFDNLATALSVDEALLRGYERAAESLAARVVSEPALLDALDVSTASDLASRADAFIEHVGLRAHRRPLSSEQQAGYRALFDLGPELFPGLGEFEAGARAVLEAMLQSPYFLYRFEQSQEVVGEVIPLDDYEVASRLSYFLWDTMPDEALFEAAAEGELVQPREVASQAARMLADPRGGEMLVHFHAQLLEAERFDSIDPANTVYDGPGGLGAHARTEQAMYVTDVLADRDGSLADLLTTPRTFVNAELASIYGLDGDFDEEFVPVSLDPTERAGVFTQVGFLALNASAVHPDPIHRGAFLAKRMACLTIAAPPDEIPPLPDPAGRTNRQRVEDHTEQPGSTCAGCHVGLINPFGFPFEGYDAVGRFRTEDLGMPIDSQASPMLDGEPRPVDDAVELAEAMAESESVHRCYAQRWVEFAYGRDRAPEDRALVDRLAEASLADDTAVLDLIVSMVRSEAFLTRSQEELP